MKHITIIAIYLLSVISAFAASEASKKVSAEAQTCADALIKAEYETFARYTHPKVVEMMGGKEKMIELLRAGVDQMKEKGIKFADMTAGEAEEPRVVGDLVISIVPQTLVMKSPDMKIIQESSLLGISSDKGKTWSFIELGTITQEQFNTVFPDLADHVKIPKKKEAIIEKND
jgi:hypothetical protein